MKRRDFYIEYYKRTDRIFSDKIIWGKKEREEAWRKGQIYTISKFGRKLRIAMQYLVLPLCLLSLFFDNIPRAVAPIMLFISLLTSFITDFSIIKIELLYSIYRKNGVFGAALHEIFRGEFSGFLEDLRRLTRKITTGYILIGGGQFYGRYTAVCRDKNNKILLTFQRNKVRISINGNVTIIKNSALAKDELLTEIAAVINGAM